MVNGHPRSLARRSLVRFCATVIVACTQLSAPTALAESYLVKDQASYEKIMKGLQPGDEAVLANGNWQNFEIVLDATGTADEPITLRAETPGKVIISGRSNLSLGGEHLIVSGLTFRDGYSPTKAVVSFRLGSGSTGSGKLANNTRLTQVVIDSFNKPKRTDEDNWIQLSGKSNRVDHNYFAGKTNKGPTLIVRLDSPASRQNGHVIEQNFFGHRPSIGGNGGETLRIGVSDYSRTSSQTSVVRNFFERCDGEVEIISIKAEDNKVSENLFFESRGAVVFRHGGRNVVSRNVFFGNGVPDTGGVRIINDKQTVSGNYFEDLRGEKFLSALTIMNGVPNSPINRYHQVKGAKVTNNSFVGFVSIGLAVGSDEERSAAPVDSTVTNNLFITDSQKPVFVFDDISGIQFDINVSANPAMKNYATIAGSKIKMARAENGLLYPVDKALSDVGAPRDLKPVKREETGPEWFTKPPQSPAAGREVAVASGGQALARAVAESKAGDVLTLEGSSYELQQPLEIAHPLVIRSKDNTGEKTKLAAKGSAIFEIASGAELSLSGLALVGSADNKSLIHARGNSYTGSYVLKLTDTEASAGKIVAGSPFLNADAGTFATSIELEQVTVRGWPGPFIALSGEKMDGWYLAEDLKIDRSKFEDLKGPLIEFGREGRDESTFGPRVELENSSLTGVNPGGDAIYLKGVDGLVMRDNALDRSGKVRVKKRVLGLGFVVTGNNFKATPAPEFTGVEDEPLSLGPGFLEKTVPAETVPANKAGLAEPDWAKADAPRPSLILTSQGVTKIRAAKASYPLFESTLAQARDRVKQSMTEGVIVPLPKDPGGGYTHERHKENYKVIHDAGLLYQISENTAYAEHAKALLLAYAEMYPQLGLHPAKKEQSPGRLFWQNLNESVWLVYSIQGYDAIAETLSDSERSLIENKLLRPMADFLSLESPETFRKIHNHGTWAAAAVGMTGYALRDPALVTRALKGLDGDGSSGFFAQLTELFSPDGYYTEGPYYQRYALMPFVVFAQSIQSNEPDLQIFAFRERILLKAIDATIQQSYDGKFLPINDAIKSKGLDTQELVYGVAAAFGLTGRKDLLSIARYQGKTVLSADGFSVAEAAAKSAPVDFAFRSMLLRDGPKGDHGGLAIMRMGKGELAQTLVAKDTSQGFNHGHFDKLSIMLFDSGNEILADYGAARFLNVATKNGGHYLRENDTWAKQSIAHNTLVLNESSQFAGDWQEAQKHWPEILYSNFSDDLNVVSASLDNAYPDASVTRTVAQVSHESLSAPLVVDVLHADSAKAVTFDLPFYVQAQLVDFRGELSKNAKSLKPLGGKNGYQHLWLEGVGKPEKGPLQMTWLKDRSFYTLHSLAPNRTSPVVVRLGANDPDFNLLPVHGVILRAPKAESATFVNLFETHGVYDAAEEFTRGSEPQITGIEHLRADGVDLVIVALRGGGELRISISNDPAPDKVHKMDHDGDEWEWQGFIDVRHSSGSQQAVRNTGADS